MASRILSGRYELLEKIGDGGGIREPVAPRIAKLLQACGEFGADAALRPEDLDLLAEVESVPQSQPAERRSLRNAGKWRPPCSSRRTTDGTPRRSRG